MTVSRRTLGAFGVIVTLGVLSSVVSLANGFAYDDIPIIADNALVHDWHHLAHRFVESYWPPDIGGALYRPITIALFTIEWALGGGSPLAFHVANVLLYVGVCVVVYRLAAVLLEPRQAILAGALFAVDPVHVEAVANAVGQSELIAALCVCAAVSWYLTRRAVGALRGRDVAVIATLYAIGLMAKEHAIILPALLIAAEYTVIRAKAPVRELRPFFLTLGLVATAYLAMRVTVLGNLTGDYPSMAFRDADWPTRWWTMLGVVPEWVRLLVFPAHLAAAYSPSGTPVRSGLDLVTVIGALLLMASVALAFGARHRWPVLSFGLFWVALALAPVSNVIVRSGVLLAERTMFLPSVGVVLGVASLVTRWRTATVATAALVVAAGAWRSATRDPVWRSTESVFRAAVIDEPMSYAAHFGLASVLFTSGDRANGEREARAAIALYPSDPRVSIALATEYASAGMCPPAEVLAHEALAAEPHSVRARLILGNCRARAEDYVGLRAVAMAGLADGHRQAVFRRMLRSADSAARAARTQ